MNIQNPVQPYMRPAVQNSSRRYPRPRRSGVVVDTVVWKPVVKVLLLLLVPVFAVNVYLGSAIRNTESSIAVIENKKYELRLENFELQAAEENLKSPQQIERMAGEKLSLFRPKGQVARYNYRKGCFLTL
jgi:hypothetical protein